MKLLYTRFLFIILVFPLCLYGQSHKPSHCEILQKALEVKIYYKNLLDSNTIIVDTAGYFENCHVSLQGKELTIIKECAPLFPFLRSRATHEELCTRYKNYRVCSVTEGGNKVVLWFWRPCNNDAIKIILTVKKNKVIVTSSQEGQF